MQAGSNPGNVSRKVSVGPAGGDSWGNYYAAVASLTHGGGYIAAAGESQGTNYL